MPGPRGRGWLRPGPVQGLHPEAGGLSSDAARWGSHPASPRNRILLRLQDTRVGLSSPGGGPTIA